MKIISQDYINGLNGTAKKISKIIYTINGTTTTLTSDNLFSVTVRQNTDLLRTIMKELEFVSDRAIPLETIVKYKFGVYTGSDYEYVDYGNYIVFSCEKQEESNNYRILAYDNMLKAKVEYKTLQHGTFPMTIRSYINNLCTDLGLTFANASSTFANYDKIINDDLYANLGYTYFDIFDELSQVTASNIAIDSTNKVEIRYITNSGVTIDEDYLKNYNISTKEKYGTINTIVLTRSAGSDSIYYPSILPENPYELKIEDNQIMNFDNRDDFLPDIYNKLNGLQFYTNDYVTYGITFLDLCDMYNLEVNNTTYPCLMLNTELIVTDGVEEKVYTSMPNTSSTKYETASATDRLINRTSLIVDKQGQQITSVVSQIGDRSEKTTTITQDIDGIQSQVELIADITDEQESNSASISFTKVLASEILELNVRPINNNISYLYPRNNLYPSNNLYSTNRKIRFLNTTTSEFHDYELPDDLLYYDSTHYDEFTLNYTDKICQIVKKCKYNASGEVELLTTPITETFEYPQSTDVAFDNGDYTLTILGYNQGYIKAKIVLQNDFTSQMATKVEMNSEISQTAAEINLEVSKKVGNDEVISKINQSAEQITISANKVNISGVITAINNDTSTTIDGNKITTGTLNADTIYGGTISASTINLSNTILSPSSSQIGGWTIASSYLYNGGIDGNNGARLYSDGRFYMKNNYGWLNTGTGGTIISGNGATYPVVISDNFTTTLPSNNDTIAIRAFNGTVHVNSNYGVYANNTLLAGGSSKKMKQNIKELSQKEVDTIYNELKNLPRYQYDYKEKYSGQKNNYGFIIEDFENKKLGEILHIVKGEENTKYYSHNDLTLVNSIIIQELMKKIEKLEKEMEEIKCKK